MRRIEYTDMLGRKTLVLIPDDAPDSEGYRGIPIGPPALDALKLPPELQTRLHNELFARGLYSVKDVNSRPNDVASAIVSALKLDVSAIRGIYAE